MLKDIIQICSAISGVSAVIVLIIKPLREKILGVTELRDGQKCLLRSEMLRIYYRHIETKTMRQYEYENFQYCYKAYKREHGNSFIDHIREEVEEWKVVQ